MANPVTRSAALIDSADEDVTLDAARALLVARDVRVELSPFAEALQQQGLGVERAPADDLPSGYVSAARHDFPFDVAVDLGLPVSTAPAVQANLRTGPYEGPTGRFWLTLYGPEESEQVWQPGASRPTLVMTAARLPTFELGDRYVVELDAGTVWVQADTIAPGAPDDTYVGLLLTSGSLALTQAPTITDGRLTTAGALQATLTGQLAQDPPVAGGLCPLSASVSGPQTVRISWGPAGVTIELGRASATVAGTEITLDPYTGPASWDADLDVVTIGYTVAPAFLDLAILDEPTATFTGVSQVTGGWALPLVRPDGSGQLGQAATAGMVALTCADPVELIWPGAAQGVRLTQPRLLVQPGQVILSSRHSAAVEDFNQRLLLWAVRDEPDAPRLPLTLGFGAAMTVAFVCDAVGGVGLYATCGVAATLDRPVDIAGRPVGVPNAALGLMSLHRVGSDTTVQVIGLAPSIDHEVHLLALRNGLMTVQSPRLLLVSGQLADDGDVDNGKLLMPLGVTGWSPTLPDPYVTDLSGITIKGRSESTSLLLASVTWADPASPVLAFAGALPPPDGNREQGTAEPARGVRQGANQVRVPTQTEQGSLLKVLRLAHDPAVAEQADVREVAAPDAVAEQGSGYRLLDVSTHQDLLGVELTTSREGGSFQVRDLDICTPASALRVFTLPQVQWEPVRTLDQDQDIPALGYFPTPLASVTDGGATELSLNSVRLVPAIPDLAVDAVLDGFESGEPARLVTTLPFGLRAWLELRPTASADGRRQDTVARNEPDFDQLRGGAQLAFTAESGPSGRDESSYFDGAALQLLNGVALDTGAPLGLSVLGSVLDPTDSVETMFNDEFGPGKSTARVPVTRLDISGYGGSTFSDWTKRSAAYADAAKIQFQVIVGRTALEVVKFATVLYPWGIRLTRTVTIERRGGGGVIRRDSGWQASTPGLFQFPAGSVPTPEYVVHPGVLRGLFDVRNIVPTGQPPISFVGHDGQPVTLVPKFFDARVHLDGVDAPDGLAGVGLLGYLQVLPIGERLHENDLRALLLQQGAAGGPIDGPLDVGGSGFRVRATRVEVGTAVDSTGRPQLVGAVRSAPIFQQNGAWSAIRMPGPANPQGDAEAVDVSDVKGLPVVREGQLLGVVGDTMTIGLQTDYRFADPADVHEPDHPVNEYGFLQSSSAHAFVFPRPYVDAGVAELRSRTQPRFADPYSRGTSKGLFPPVVNAITLPTNVLAVDATGAFRLRDNVDVTAPRGPLVLGQMGADTMQADYATARLQLSISPAQWHMDLPSVEVWTDCLGISKVAGVRTRFVAGTNDRPVVTDIVSLLQQDLETALTFLTGFSARPTMGPFDLGTSNTVTEHKFSLQVDHDWTFPPSAPGSDDKHAELKLTIGGKAELGWSTDDAPPPDAAPGTTFEVGVALTAGIEGKIPLVGVLFLLLGLELEIGGAVEFPPMAVAKPKFEFDLKAYIGVGIDAGIFEGSLAIGYHLAIEGATVKNGIFGKLEAELDLKILKVGVEGEFGGLWYADTTHPPNMHAADVAGEVQVNVDLLFIAIHASYEYQSTSYFS